jgi:5'(3')-deoxyribonucleotidase
MKRRILIDQDGTIYDLYTPWYAAHNKDYPAHDLKAEDVTGWNTQAICDAAGCAADIYSYFNHPEVWRDGKVIEGATKIINGWHNYNIADLGILTTAANSMSVPYKIEWLQKNFPYIKDIIVVFSHIKHLLRGDILIDDGVHNLAHWEGIGILYNQPWNQGDNGLVRANDWDHVDWLVRRSLIMLDQRFAHKEIESILSLEGKKK